MNSNAAVIEAFTRHEGKAPLLWSIEDKTTYLQEILLNELLLCEEQVLKADLYGLLAEIYGLLSRLYPIEMTDVDIHSFLLATVFDIVQLKAVVLTDIHAALWNDPSTSDPMEVLTSYPGIRAVLMQRVAHLFWVKKVPLLPRLMMSRVYEKTGIDIHPAARIGTHFFIDHGSGVVIGETTEIGNHVILFQGVTLGAKKIVRDKEGHALKHVPRHPIIGDRVTIYSGATVLGRITVGEGSIIGGNVWITENVPANSRITQQHFVAQCFADGDGI